jgi:phosphoglycolate phosphatase
LPYRPLANRIAKGTHMGWIGKCVLFWTGCVVFNPMRQYRLVIFDLDGTLINAYPAIIRSFNHTMRSLGYPPQDARTICRAVGGGDTALLKPFLQQRDLAQAQAVYRRHHARALLRWSYLFPGVKDLLKRLRSRGLLLAVASNRPSRFALILLRHLGIAQSFDYILCGDQVARNKPNQLMLRMIMRRLKVTPAETVYVGDMTIDIKTGTRAGVQTVAVATGSSTRAELARAKPDALITDIRHLTSRVFCI